MKIFTAALLVFGLTLTASGFAAPTSAPPSTNITWLAAAGDADIERAFTQARAAKKPVLLYWGATWCPPCNQLKATFFNRQDFAAASRSFVAVHVDGDRPGAQKLGSRFKVSGYPTVVLLRPDGAEITRLPGEADPEQMMAVLQLGMAGGRPVKAVLADARAGKPMTAGEWRMLAFYSWATDEQQLVPKADQASLLAELARATPAADLDTRTRLWLKALAASAAGQGIKADDALRALVLRVLADPAQSRLHADLVGGNAAEIVRALADEEEPERALLVQAFDGALRRLVADAGLSRGDRITALISRIELARFGQPRDLAKVVLPDALRAEVREHVARDDREIVDAYQRQAVITAGAYALGFAGLWDESDALLRGNLARSHSPYYLMNQLGNNARKLGKPGEALRWYAQAWDRSTGPATRLQWGSGYLAALVDLAPQDAARIEETAAGLIAEAGADSGAFEGRSARSMQRMAKKLEAWNADGQHEAVLRRLRAQLNGVCARVAAADGRKASCQALLQAPAKAA